MNAEVTSNAAPAPDDCDLQDVPVCPHCGHRHCDAWEWNFGNGMEGSADHDCDNCGEEFHVEREVTVYFSTTIKPEARAALTKAGTQS